MNEKEKQLLMQRILKLESIIDELSEQVTSKHCPVCSGEFPIYEPFGTRKNAQCPNCKALERHRALIRYLQIRHGNSLFENGKRVLQYWPDIVFINKFNKMSWFEYLPLSDKFDFQEITQTAQLNALPFNDGAFDSVILVHVLDKMATDFDALREVKRVLAVDGKAFIMSPVTNNLQTEELSNIDPRKSRVTYRKYSKEDFISRLKACGFEVTICDLYEELSVEHRRLFGIPQGEYVFECRVYK